MPLTATTHCLLRTPTWQSEKEVVYRGGTEEAGDVTAAIDRDEEEISRLEEHGQCVMK